jgi:hypothetical protein
MIMLPAIEQEAFFVVCSHSKEVAIWSKLQRAQHPSSSSSKAYYK